jgi:transcriptional regulator with XRE-family HTH domain
MRAEKQSLGAELRQLREIRKLSLREVEGATGISNPYLSQLENDKIKKPSPHFLYKLSNLYGVDYQLIMERAGYAGPRKESTGPKTLAGAALFATADLTEQEEEKLMEYLQFLRRKQK